MSEEENMNLRILHTLIYLFFFKSSNYIFKFSTVFVKVMDSCKIQVNFSKNSVAEVIFYQNS